MQHSLLLWVLTAAYAAAGQIWMPCIMLPTLMFQNWSVLFWKMQSQKVGIVTSVSCSCPYFVDPKLVYSGLSVWCLFIHYTQIISYSFIQSHWFIFFLTCFLVVYCTVSIAGFSTWALYETIEVSNRLESKQVNLKLLRTKRMFAGNQGENLVKSCGF